MSVQVVSFTDVQSAFSKHFKEVITGVERLFRTDADGDTLWDTYLKSFPKGSNPLYKTRTKHDCGCCRHFIKQIGGVVRIVDGKIITMWDFAVDGPYQQVVDALAAYVRTRAVSNVFLHAEKMVGTASSRQLLEDKSVKTWEHFHVNLPKSMVARKADIGKQLGKYSITHSVMYRSLEEIAPDAVQTVLELVAQNSLYRGEEHTFAVREFQKLQTRYKKVPARQRNLFVWENMGGVHPSVSRIRNSVIGTLLVDLSEGRELEDAVKSYELKVAPMTYKRPTALVTKAMIASAQKKVEELGLTTALERRYAVLDDISVTNVLFADRAVRRALKKNVFEDIASATAVDVKKLGKVEEVAIDDFLSNVVPMAQSIEVLFENHHAGNLVSLVAPVDATARQLFKWPNGFSWSYTGDLADSIKERVKKAGGSVTGDFRASLAWFNYDDLDLHLTGPNDLHISFRSRRHPFTKGELDVDMNAGSGRSCTPVENITFPDRQKMLDGEYTLYVNQFCSREKTDVGFEVEIEFDGTTYSYAWPNAVGTNQNVVVCKFAYSRKDGFKIVQSLPSKLSSKTVWNLSTQTFHKVRLITLSPNQWDGRNIGNRHYFFMLEGCRNEGTARGFFNEFLCEELTPHRKVLEIVGSRMQTDESEQQLSGIGFSSTQRNHLLCRVTGAFSRVVKVRF